MRSEKVVALTLIPAFSRSKSIVHRLMGMSQDAEATVLRRPSVEDKRIAQREVRKAGFTKLSMMPEGLLDALKPEEVSDLFAYLKTLK